MTLPHPIPEALVEQIAHRFRVLAEPTRIRIVDALREGPATVTELQTALGASQQNVSKHLAVLLDAALVRRARDGNRAYWSIADPSLFDLCEIVCGSLRRHVTELDNLLQLEGEPTS